MRAGVRRAAAAGKARHARTLAAVRRWDVEYRLRRAKIAESSQLAALLEEHIRALLASTRWRLGNALVSWATLSPGRRGALHALFAHTVDAQESRREAIRTMVNGFAEMPADLASQAIDPSAPSPAGSDAARDAKLLRMTLERRLKASQQCAEGAALAGHVAALVQIAEALRKLAALARGQWPPVAAEAACLAATATHGR